MSEAKFDPYHPASPLVRDNPYPIYDQLRSHDPVFWSGTLNRWLVTGYREVAALAADSRLSPGGNRFTGLFDWIPSEQRSQLAPFAELLKGWPIFNDPPRHTELRKLVSHAFRPDKVERLRPAITGILTQLFDGIHPVANSISFRR
ncbi:unnamed protein product [Sphagnum balticum]